MQPSRSASRPLRRPRRSRALATKRPERERRLLSSTPARRHRSHQQGVDGAQQPRSQETHRSALLRERNAAARQPLPPLQATRLQGSRAECIRAGEGGLPDNADEHSTTQQRPEPRLRTQLEMSVQPANLPTDPPVKDHLLTRVLRGVRATALRVYLQPCAASPCRRADAKRGQPALRVVARHDPGPRGRHYAPGSTVSHHGTGVRIAQPN